MAERRPAIADGILSLPGRSDAAGIVIGVPAWWAWLDEPATRSFTFRDPAGHFTARKEYKQRGAGYWVAYRKVAGQLRKAYLGKAAELTLERLRAAAAALAPPPLRTQEPPPMQPSVPALPLLTTKLYMPPPRPHLVPRPRLIARLRRGMTGKLTVIAAPAGFGKTTLLASWIAERQKAAGESDDLLPFAFCLLPSEVAWLSLDAADNDPTRFWSYVSAALDTLAPGVGTSALALLQSPQPPPIEAVLTTLLNALSARAAGSAAAPPDVLVLDDYHVIEAQPIHQALTTLIDYLPPHLHLVIASRADLPLPLARWRVRGALAELRASDLRFTPAETEAFLIEVMRLPLSAADSATLEAHTEGWIAGLHLAALAMQDRADLAGFIRAFTGSNRFVVDYLAEEVIARQPAHLQAFLLQTSILDRMCGPLCDAVVLGDGTGTPHTTHNTEAAYSQFLLEHLERANVFTIALDDARRWYRYHHLFAEALRERLHAGATSAGVATLHRRASQWYEQNGLLPEAISHALVAPDVERAVRLIEQSIEPMLKQGEYITLQGWLDRLPPEVVRARPRLCLLCASTSLVAHQLEVAERWLEDAERGMQAGDVRLDEIMFSEIALLRAGIAHRRQDFTRAIELSQRALEIMADENLLLRGKTMLILGNALYWGGQVDAADHAFAESSRLAAAVGDSHTALNAISNQGIMLSLKGQLHQAAAIYRHGLLLAGERNAQQMPITSLLHSNLAGLLYEWNDLDAASFHLKEAIELSEQSMNPHMILTNQIELARLSQAQGDAATVHQAIQRATRIVREYNLPPSSMDDINVCQVRLWLAQGNAALAIAWAQASGLSVDDDLSLLREDVYLMLAHVLIALGQSDQAIKLLGRLLSAAEVAGRIWIQIELIGLQAVAFQARGETAVALNRLARALTIAERQGYIRSFVHIGPSIVRLLREARARGIAPDYVERLLAAFGELSIENEALRTTMPPDAQSSMLNAQLLVEPLSGREREVLRLVAAGLSNQAIAQQLVVALSTVKKHINNVYTKLGVQSRTQALARARELHLL